MKNSHNTQPYIVEVKQSARISYERGTARNSQQAHIVATVNGKQAHIVAVSFFQPIEFMPGFSDGYQRCVSATAYDTNGRALCSAVVPVRKLRSVLNVLRLSRSIDWGWAPPHDAFADYVDPYAGTGKQAHALERSFRTSYHSKRKQKEDAAFFEGMRQAYA